MSKQEQSAPPTFSTEELGNFDLLVEGIFKILSEQLGFVQPCLVWFDKKNERLQVVKNNSHPLVNAILKKFLGRGINDIYFPIFYGENAFVKTFKEQKINFAKSTYELAVPTMTKTVTNVVDRVIGLKIIILVPLIFETKSVGVLAFGSKEKATLNEKELHSLSLLGTSFANYLSVFWDAPENSFHSPENIAGNKLLLNLDKEFLLNVGELLKELGHLQGASNEVNEVIKENIDYLNSLVLIHESIEGNEQNNSKHIKA